MKLRNLTQLAIGTMVSLQTAWATPEVFQIGSHNVDQLPKGKEADGILHDLVIRNDKVEALIAFDSPRRRANMGTFYGDNGQTPGCLYDLTLRGSDNDQITVFSPSNQRGPVTAVSMVKDGSDGEAIIETTVSGAMNGQLAKKHRYILKDGWQGLIIVTTWHNQSSETKEISTGDTWTRFDSANGQFNGIRWADSVDPADKAGYAISWIEYQGSKAPESEVKLEPGQHLTYARFLAVGTSPGEAIGLVANLKGEVANLKGSLKDADGNAIATATITFSQEDESFPVYPDANGNYQLNLAPGEYEVSVADLGRQAITDHITVSAGQKITKNVTMNRAATVHFTVTDQAGKDIPCKVQFHGLKDTKNPKFGPQNRAHGCVDQYHSETGSFQVAVPPGDYEIRISRGMEYSLWSESIHLDPEENLNLSAKLNRLVSTKGWVSTDFHNHSTPSGDNTCGTDDRLINLAAEQIEFAPTTEHNRIYDWEPHIKKLGLDDEMSTVVGMELTGSGAHFNAFPLKAVPHTQDGGAPVWVKDPRLNAIVLRDYQGGTPDRWLHINHPDMVENFIDRTGDGLADGGFKGLTTLIDGIETQNYRTSNILSPAPISVVSQLNKVSVNYIREFIWLQLLNQGHPYRVIAVSDAHSVYGNGVGGWRTYIPSSTDDPAQIDWQEISRNAKAGRMVLSSGPYLEVTAEDGTIAGESTRANGGIKLHVRVQCSDWIDIDRIQVLVNSRQIKALNFTRESHPDMFADGVLKFDQWIDVPLSQDSHLIVVAIGENFSLERGFGTSPQSDLQPCAYNNPIYVDVDGGGFKPNGDTLGFDLPVAGLSVEEAERILGLK